MPIKRSSFENGNFRQKNIGSREDHAVSVFLRKHSSQAFTLKEIVAATKMNSRTTASMLGRLRKDGLVLHKSPYYAWNVPQKKKVKAKRR